MFFACLTPLCLIIYLLIHSKSFFKYVQIFSKLREAEKKLGEKGGKQSNNWAHAEQRPLMCFLKGLPKAFSRNVSFSQYINVWRTGDFRLFEISSSAINFLPSLHLESGQQFCLMNNFCVQYVCCPLCVKCWPASRLIVD